jgi:acyl-CoA reductase-like NAD-dependent aldehyde dehydrogenase
MLKVFNPATGKVIRSFKEDTSASIAKKFRNACRAQKNWAATPISDRIAIVRNLRSLVESERERLAELLTTEVGKPITQSENEIQGLFTRIDFFLEQSAVVLKNETVFSDPQGTMVETIAHEPLGVIANISAWNYPYFVGSNVFLPALLAGNAVLYKPSEFATLTGLAIADLFTRAGLPKNLFIPVVGRGSVGSALLKLPLNGVFFTGSYATGNKIAALASKRMMKVQLELGGKDPVYVCDDMDVESAARSTADGAFYNNGQSCCAIERLYVHKGIFKPFVEAFVESVRGFPIGDPNQAETYIGPLTRKEQIAVLENQIRDAKSKGAKLLCGGKRIPGPGNFFEPTVFSNANHKMRLMKEETFGPLIGIQAVGSDEEAMRLMNDTEYGLTAGVYTKDTDRASRILKHVNAGSAYVNCCDRVSPRLPWSGRGHSGLGLTLSKYGILAFTQPKAWHFRAFS